jgi:hypothetical protein
MCVAKENSGFKKVNGMTKLDKIMKHLRTVGNISIREAMDDYNISGGALTKYISVLRNDYEWPIAREFRKHPITGDRYARYTLTNQAA